jgi:hypothetical protein
VTIFIALRDDDSFESARDAIGNWLNIRSDIYETRPEMHFGKKRGVLVRVSLRRPRTRRNVDRMALSLKRDIYSATTKSIGDTIKITRLRPYFLADPTKTRRVRMRCKPDPALETTNLFWWVPT